MIATALLLLCAIGWGVAVYALVDLSAIKRAHVEAQRSRGELSREIDRLNDRIVALRTNGGGRG